MSLLDKTNIANVIASIAIISGIASVFLNVASNEMLVLITGAGIGYLFKNGMNSVKTKTPGIDPNTGQPFTS